MTSDQTTGPAFRRRLNGGGVGADLNVRPRADQPKARDGGLHQVQLAVEPGFAGRHAVVLGGAAVIVIGLAVRTALILQNGLGHLPDTDFFLAWTRSLYRHGLAGFYDTTSFCDYPPLFVLVMWAVGQIASFGDATLSSAAVLRTVLKTPTCMADLAIALMLLVEGRRLLGGRRAVVASALYFLNPVSIYNSAYWGQVDAIHTAVILLGVILSARGRWGMAGGAMALALLAKFQSIAFVPLFLFEAYAYRRWRGIGAMLVGATVAAAWVCLPFALEGVLGDVLQRGYIGVVGQYDRLSPSAFNIWQLFGPADAADTIVPHPVALAAAGGERTVSLDGSPLLWLTWRHISMVAYAVVVATILSLYSYRPGAIARLRAAGLLALAFFLIPTEMHERYAHPAVALLALWAVTGQWRQQTFFVLSALLLLNLTHVLPVGDVAPHIAAAIVFIFIVLLVWTARAPYARGTDQESIPMPVAPEAPPQPSAVISWFRRLTYVTVAFLLAGSVAIAQLARASWNQYQRSGDRYLSDVTPVAATQGWGTLGEDRTVVGGTIQLGGEIHLRGLGTHAPSRLTFDVPPGFDDFVCLVGIDRSTGGGGSVVASVEIDGKNVFQTPPITGKDAPIPVRIPVSGAKTIALCADPTSDGNRRDHVDWGSARFTNAD